MRRIFNNSKRMLGVIAGLILLVTSCTKDPVKVTAPDFRQDDCNNPGWCHNNSDTFYYTFRCR